MARQDGETMISELSELYGLTPRAIRFYEERGLVESSRDWRNRRRFDMRARDRLKFIAELRRAGLGLTDIHDVLDLEDLGADAQRSAVLGKLMARRKELESGLQEIDSAISGFVASQASLPAANAPERRRA